MNRLSFLHPLSLFAVIFMASFFVFSMVPMPAYADNVSDGLNQLKDDAGDALPNTIFGEDKKPSEIFAQILNIALGIGFAIAVVMVIYGGYQYITSAGNEEQATKGRMTLIYSLLGIVIILLSFVLVRATVTFITNNS